MTDTRQQKTVIVAERHLGALRIGALRRFQNQLREASATEGTTTVVVDLRYVEDCGAAFVGTLLAEWSNLRRRAVGLQVSNTKLLVDEVLKTCGVFDLLYKNDKA